MASFKSSRHARKSRDTSKAERPNPFAIERLEDRVLLTADLSLVETGLKSAYLANLQNQLNNSVFKSPVPVVGDQLSNPTKPAGQIMKAVNDALANFNLPQNPTVSQVTAALNASLGGFVKSPITVSGADGDQTILFQLNLGGTNISNVGFDFQTGLTDPTPFTDTNDDPLLQPLLGIQDQVHVNVDWNLSLQFGVTDNTFFFNIGQSNELKVTVDANLLANFKAQGKLGIMPAEFTDDSADPSSFHGDYKIDVFNFVAAPGDNRLLLTNLGAMALSPVLDGSGQINLKTNASFIPNVPGVHISSISVFSVEALMDARMPFTYTSQVPGSTTFGGNPHLDLLHVRADLAPLFNHFINPVMQELQRILLPMKPGIDFLTKPIPILGDIVELLNGSIPTFKGKDATIVDLAYALAPVHNTSTNFIYAATRRSLDLAEKILDYQFITLDKQQLEPLGDFTTGAFGQIPDPSNSSQFLRAVRPIGQTVDTLQKITQDPSVPASAHTFFGDFGIEVPLPEALSVKGGTLSLSDAGVGFAFPLLSNPIGLFEMILDTGNVALFTANLQAGLGFSYTFEIPIADFVFNFEGVPVGGGGVTLEISLGLDAALNFGFGIDSTGLKEYSQNLLYGSTQELADSASNQGVLMRKGFFFLDHRDFDPNALPGADQNPTTDDNKAQLSGGDAPEFTLSASFGMGPGLVVQALIFELGVSVQTSITVDLFVDFNDLPDFDPNSPTYLQYDGRIHLDELRLITNVDPISIFNLSGSISIGFSISIFLRACYPEPPFCLALFQRDFNIATIKIADFNFPTHTSDANIIGGIGTGLSGHLASVDANGVLTPYIGPNNNRGVLGNIEDEPLDIVYVSTEPDGSETLKVIFYGFYEETFSGVKSLNINGGTGDDRIYIGPNVSIPATVHGGSGRDYLVYNGGAIAYLYGDSDKDTLVGGDRNDYLEGGEDEDHLDGRGGDDTLVGDSQSPNVGTGNDTLRGRDGNDQLYGDYYFPGNHTAEMTAGDGNDYLDGGNGADTISDGGGYDVIDGGTSDNAVDLFYLGTAPFSSNVDDHDEIIWHPGDGIDKADPSSVATGPHRLTVNGATATTTFMDDAGLIETRNVSAADNFTVFSAGPGLAGRNGGHPRPALITHHSSFITHPSALSLTHRSHIPRYAPSNRLVNPSSSISGDLSILSRSVLLNSANLGQSSASPTAFSTYSSAVRATSSGRPILVRTLNPARWTWVSPIRLTTGTPIQRASRVVVWPL
jgi:Ca2+-binding RTX toxin-like protein